MDKEELLKWLESSKGNLFATYSSTKKASEYAVDMMPALEDKSTMVIALGIYHNTLLQAIINAIKEEGG